MQQLKEKNSKEFWKLVRELRSKKGKNLSDNIDPEIWYDWFKKLNNINYTLSDDTYRPMIRNPRDFVPQSVKMLDKPIDVDEIKKAALKLRNGKSVGMDLISNEMIKCCVDSHFVRPIRELFNFILVESKVPTCRKQSLITPIFKSGQIYNPSDHRGITVTSCFSKHFTLIINKRLASFIDAKAILKPNQTGFRRKFRTSDHIFVLNTLLNSYFANGKPVYSCFVHFSKAYD